MFKNKFSEFWHPEASQQWRLLIVGSCEPTRRMPIQKDWEGEKKMFDELEKIDPELKKSDGGRYTAASSSLN